MNDTLAQHLTTQFYLWEHRGRGWTVWDNPIDIEPPFQPFYFYIPPSFQNIDDGKQATFLSEISDSVKGFFSSVKQQNVEEYEDNIYEQLNHSIFECEEEIHELYVSFSSQKSVSLETLRQFLTNLSITQYPISFEIIATSQKITFLFTCRDSDLLLLKQLLSSYFPTIQVREESQYLYNNLQLPEDSTIIDVGLADEFMRPIKTFSSFTPDPLIGLFSVMESLEDDERIIFQILFQGTHYPWTASILRAVQSSDGSSFFADDPRMLSLSFEKVRSPLFAVVMRVLIQSEIPTRRIQFSKGILGWLQTLKRFQSNELIPLNNHGYEDDLHFQDILNRQSRRHGMILNSEELLSCLHLPTTYKFRTLETETRKTRKAPLLVEKGDYLLGINTHEGVSTNVYLTDEQRFSHMYIIGATGTGKSTLMLNLIIQDMEKGNGCCVLDPHGELIENIIGLIPEERIDDVILFDTTDQEHLVGFNFFEIHSEIEKTVLVSDFVSILQRFATSWGDQMTIILGNAVATLVEYSSNTTLLDLKQFLIDSEFRNRIIKSISDDILISFWQKEFPLIRGNTLGSVLTRLDMFLRSKIIRSIVGQKKGININEILSQGKILLVKLSQGIIGEENSFLLGSLLVSKIQQAVMSREAVSKAKRKPFYLYIDEFQNFVTPSMQSILSSARKYKMGLILAHQDVQQLWSKDSNLANSVITNSYSRICFRLGDFDSQKLSNGFSNYDISDLQKMSVGETLVRVERADNDFNMKVLLPPTISDEDVQRNMLILLGKIKQQYQSKVASNVSHTVSSHHSYSTHETASKIEKMPNKKRKLKREKTQHDEEDQSQHRYLQTLIKKIGEQFGYKAIIEKPINDGDGRVDVSLEKGSEFIACEISITTSKDHEMHNIEKCLDAGFTTILICTTDNHHLESIKQLAREKFSKRELEKIEFILADYLFTFFSNKFEYKKQAKEQTLKGYRVNIEFKDKKISKKEEAENIISKVILKSLKRQKDKN
ncbi:MAG: type IV secretory system conjugative DNA transfer family protein [Melioribacteraceae bacterium]|nr:type IV secretory system conjugative DNA transfer family protein [Melioribacteraceae bacterium]